MTGDRPPGAAHRRRLGRRAAATRWRRRTPPRRRDAVPAAVLGAHARRRVLPRRAAPGWPTRPRRCGSTSSTPGARPTAGRRRPDASRRTCWMRPSWPRHPTPARLRLRPDAVRRSGRGLARSMLGHDPAIDPHRTIRRFVMTKLDGNVLAGRLADVLGCDATAADRRAAPRAARTARSRVAIVYVSGDGQLSRAARTATACSRPSSRATAGAYGSGCRESAHWRSPTDVRPACLHDRGSRGRAAVRPGVVRQRRMPSPWVSPPSR